MQQHICYGCMKPITEYVCPHCGWSAGQNNQPHQLRTGTLLRGQFLVGRVLGQGGFGITYIGMDVKQNKIVAIKEYYPSFAVTRDVSQSSAIRLLRPDVQQDFLNGRERFLQESSLYARFQNIPEIVTIHSLFADNNTSYIVIDYISGIDLRRYTKIRGGKLSAEETLTILKPIIRAVDAVHKAGLVHRDITPDNIMLLSDGSVKLLDFGAAHEICDPDPNAPSDHTTTAILKQGFAPPEQYRRRGNLGPWTDEYGMCATIYYCLHGHIPPDAMERMLNDKKPDWNIPGLTKHQKKVLDKGMSLKASDRDGSMEAFYQDLYRTEPERAIPETPKNPEDPGKTSTDPIWPFLPKKSILLAAAAVAILAVVLIFQHIFHNNNSPDWQLEIPGFTKPAPTDASSEDDYPAVEASCALMWENRVYHAVILELNYQIATHPDDPRYQELLDHYRRELPHAVVADARKYADEGRYRKAIDILDHYYKNYGDPLLAEAAGDFRMEFGISNSSYIAAGRYTSLVLQDNGTIVMAGEDTHGEQDCSSWTDIVCIAAGDNHVVGLRRNGTVVSAGSNETDQKNTSGWSNVAAIAAGDYHTVALLEDGTLAAAGQLWAPRCDTAALQQLAGEKRIVSIAAGYLHTLALLEDGTVIATGENGDLQCDVESWKNIAAIYAGTRFSAGLKTDGTVVFAGNCGFDCSGWKNIDNLAAGDFFLLGLNEEGTVLSIGVEEAIGPNTPGVIAQWENISQIAAGNDHIVAVTADGKILCAGNNDCNQLHVEGFSITCPRSIPLP